jgi:hypothetical protein
MDWMPNSQPRSEWDDECHEPFPEQREPRLDRDCWASILEPVLLTNADLLVASLANGTGF